MAISSIVFVTSSNLATNPRCVKEIRVALASGIKVKVLACNIGGWSQKNEGFLLEEFKNVEIIHCDVTRADKINWLLSTIAEKLSVIVFRYFKNSTKKICAYAENKRSFLLWKKLRLLNWQADLVIAHNPAAFFPAFKFASHLNARLGIDVEDYHPGEKVSSIKKKLITRLMQSILPKATYSTYASPLIMQYTQRDIPGLDPLTCHVIDNVFPREDFKVPPKRNNTDELRLIWFSQNVDYKRGLENLLIALDDFAGKVSLTLIGNMRKEFYEKEVKGRAYVLCEDPKTQDELHEYLSTFDVGLALEDKSYDFNRDLCLTNKIWAYFQAGLYIVATDTAAQKDFFLQFSDHGTTVKNSINDLHTALLNINTQQLVSLRKKAKDRYLNASQINWENESLKLQVLWNQI